MVEERGLVVGGGGKGGVGERVVCIELHVCIFFGCGDSRQRVKNWRRKERETCPNKRIKKNSERRVKLTKFSTMGAMSRQEYCLFI